MFRKRNHTMHAVVYTVITKGWEGGQPTVEISGGKYFSAYPQFCTMLVKEGGGEEPTLRWLVKDVSPTYH